MSEIASILKLMFERQAELNRRIDPEWEKRGFPWPRAIRQECAELIDSLPWKWWAKGEPDRDNARLEVVDIWHFWISWALQERHDSEYLRKTYTVAEWAFRLTPEIERHLDDPCVSENAESAERVLEAVEILIAKTFFCSANGVVQDLARLTGLVGLSFEDLAKLYFGKNVLNRFRQEMGLKKGEYRRIWGPDGEEDNRWMMRLAQELAPPTDEKSLAVFEDELFRRLIEVYPNKSD
ncbi:dUTP diphosphatase [Thermosulfurimonas sp. F29]|uniref:dUTP diphosphatase n=1 Tax=Thermosulfurimonas sp. F29 TaxID=2867247 RepID=UPI001C83EEF9|nr:dUTP diphosphatase [Thermosulfurimonas sp. F29]MBX6424140.1 dUTP diphosphatase [Thermosulfurimonas sp. F29]